MWNCLCKICMCSFVCASISCTHGSLSCLCHCHAVLCLSWDVGAFVVFFSFLDVSLHSESSSNVRSYTDNVIFLRTEKEILTVSMDTTDKVHTSWILLLVTWYNVCRVLVQLVESIWDISWSCVQHLLVAWQLSYFSLWHARLSYNEILFLKNNMPGKILALLCK